ncbi:MAG: hypothetical protein R2719_07740 [Micropruina sp.]
MLPSQVTHDRGAVAAQLCAVQPVADPRWRSSSTCRSCAFATNCCSTGYSANTWRRCCRSSTRRPSARRSSGSATSTCVRQRGLFLSIDRPGLIEQSLINYDLDSDDVDLVVVTDSEGILGIGDQGIGGIKIALGKLGVYTAAAGIHPRRAIPVVLDVGTDNLGLLNSDVYLGRRHARVRGRRYDEFIDQFVNAVTKQFPNAMLHWEDFGAGNAHRILERYSDRICTFNDDIQGTAAVVLAAVLAAVRLTGVPLSSTAW